MTPSHEKNLPPLTITKPDAGEGKEARNPVTGLTANQMQELLDRVKGIPRPKPSPHLVAQTRRRAYEMAEKALRTLRKAKQTEAIKEQIFRLDQLLFDMRIGRR